MVGKGGRKYGWCARVLYSTSFHASIMIHLMLYDIPLTSDLYIHVCVASFARCL